MYASACVQYACMCACLKHYFQVLSSVVCDIYSTPVVFQLAQEYGSGRMLTGEVKSELIAVLQDIISKHQERRALVTDDMVKRFMTPRPLNFGKK